MATVDQWTQAQGQGNPNVTQSDGSGLQGSQTAWAQNYFNSLKLGNQDPEELSRFLNYQYLLPNAKNMNLTTSAGYDGSDLTQAQKQWMNNYAQAIASGTNNLSQLGQYQGYLKAFGGQSAAPSQNILQELSMGALNGDVGAQNYLNQMGLKPLQGADLWQGLDPTTLGGFNQGNSLNPVTQQYMKDNPYSDYTKQQDNSLYNQYSDIITGGKQLDNNQLGQYENLVQKWNLKDMTDPYNQMLSQNQQDKQTALNAQDVATNQTLSIADANNFKNMMAAQQGVVNKGMDNNSGLAQDAFSRASMAANQDYQKAYSDAAKNKSDIANTYDQQQMSIQDKQNSVQMARQQFQYQQQKDMAAQQTQQDQFLTAQTGNVWINGQLLKGSDGKPINTLDWQKMSETQRHDLAQEQIDSTKVSNDYNLGITNANNNAAKIANDYEIAKGNLANAVAKENLASQQAQASIQDAKNKLAIAMQQASTDAGKATATNLKARLDSVTSQMNAWIKAHPNAPDVPQSYKDEYASIANAMDGINFQDSQGGVVPEGQR